MGSTTSDVNADRGTSAWTSATRRLSGFVMAAVVGRRIGRQCLANGLDRFRHLDGGSAAIGYAPWCWFRTDSPAEPWLYTPSLLSGFRGMAAERPSNAIGNLARRPSVQSECARGADLSR